MEFFYEIELKALLEDADYYRLRRELPQRFELINEDTITTVRFRPGDIRLRYSDKIRELVIKDGDVTDICRPEIRMDLDDATYYKYYRNLLNKGKTTDPEWIKHKQEFLYPYRGFDYVICLQDIENFAYILEVEFISKNRDPEIHGINLKRIIHELGCEPIKPSEFKQKIEAYKLKHGQN